MVQFILSILRTIHTICRSVLELKMLLRTPLNRRKPRKKSEDERILFKIWDREKCLNNVIPAPFVRKRSAKKWSRRFLMWWCCHFYNIFTLCLPNEIRRTERGIFFRLSRLLHNCLIREQHHSGPSELSLLADHPEPSND